MLLSLCFLLVGLGVGLISPLSVFVVTEKLALPASDLKWLSIPYGLGEIVGGIVTFAVASRIAPSRLLVLGLLVNAAGMILTGLSGMLWLVMLAQFVIALLQPADFYRQPDAGDAAYRSRIYRQGHRNPHAADDGGDAAHDGAGGRFEKHVSA